MGQRTPFQTPSGTAVAAEYTGDREPQQSSQTPLFPTQGYMDPPDCRLQTGLPPLSGMPPALGIPAVRQDTAQQVVAIIRGL